MPAGSTGGTHHRQDQPGKNLPAHRRHVRGARHPRVPAAQPRLAGMLRLPPDAPDPALPGPRDGLIEFVHGRRIRLRWCSQPEDLDQERVCDLQTRRSWPSTTTCLSETIGDDIPNILKQAEIPEGKVVIHINTPSYQGSHITGFAGMCRAMVSYLSQSDGFQKDQVNVLPGFVNPGDMREIRRIVNEMGVKLIMFPDTSGVLDTPLTSRYQMYPEGGATVAEIRDAGNSSLTLALGSFASNDAADLLQEKCGVTGIPLKLPIGLKATDDFVMAIKDWFGVEVPKSLEVERGQVIDTLIDTHFHYQGKTVAIFGDPDPRHRHDRVPDRDGDGPEVRPDRHAR